MREDMFKVIVERPRWGSRHAVKSKLRYDKVPGRKRATGRRMALENAGWTKSLNENLAPLKRYLHKQVGRPWDKVYSEISAHLDANSTVKQHVRDHLRDFILIKVTIAGDGSYSAAAQQWWGPSAPQHWWAELYVDPRDGLIKRTDKLCRKLGLESRRDTLRKDRKRRVSGPPVHDLRRLSETRFLVKLKGCWFQLDTDHPPTGRYGAQLGGRDLVQALNGQDRSDAAAWTIIAKRQLSKKALAAQKLCND
ncbi:MAG: hypothetical protein AAFR51_13420 [Pseudomonadota bacterium]